MRQGPPQRSPEGALGRKRAGPWEGTELDLDDYRSSKRGRGQVRSLKTSWGPNRLLYRSKAVPSPSPSPNCPWLLYVAGNRL